MTKSVPAQDDRKEPRHFNGNSYSQWISAVSSIAMVSVAISSFLIVRGQLAIMESQLKTTQGQLEAMKVDQRPYIGLAGYVPPKRESDGTIIWNYTYKNYGKGVARNILVTDFLKVGDGVFRTTKAPISESVPFDLQPTQDGYSTGFSVQKLTQKEFSQLQHVSSALGLLIKFEYTDSYNSKYSETFCLELLESGAIFQADQNKCRTSY
jgi:hypothetical protein